MLGRALDFSNRSRHFVPHQTLWRASRAPDRWGRVGRVLRVDDRLGDDWKVLPWVTQMFDPPIGGDGAAN